MFPVIRVLPIQCVPSASTEVAVEGSGVTRRISEVLVITAASVGENVSEVSRAAVGSVAAIGSELPVEELAPLVVISMFEAVVLIVSMVDSLWSEASGVGPAIVPLPSIDSVSSVAISVLAGSMLVDSMDSLEELNVLGMFEEVVPAAEILLSPISSSRVGSLVNPEPSVELVPSLTLLVSLASEVPVTPVVFSGERGVLNSDRAGVEDASNSDGVVVTLFSNEFSKNPLDS